MGRIPVVVACAHSNRESRGSAVMAAVLMVCASLVGCGSVTGPSRPPREAKPSATGVRLSGGTSFVEIESNGDFGQANILPSDPGPLVRITGDIASPSDVDVFDLGPVSGRTNVYVELSADSQVNASLALFDEMHDLLIVDDNMNYIDGISGVFADTQVQPPAQEAIGKCRGSRERVGPADAAPSVAGSAGARRCRSGDEPYVARGRRDRRRGCAERHLPVLVCGLPVRVQGSAVRVQ